jgi:PBP1b-binding outer membrane lipoprotein LpoB
MKYINVLMMALLLQSCASNVLKVEDKESYETSKLYDPPTIHLIEGTHYQFQEGMLDGRGQKFHSNASYRDAAILSN